MDKINLITLIITTVGTVIAAIVGFYFGRRQDEIRDKERGRAYLKEREMEKQNTMRPEYYDIYNNLFTHYVDEQEFRPTGHYHDMEYQIIMTIKKSIDEVSSGNNLRPDAKYFLLVNFHHLIVAPIEEKIYRARNTNYEETKREFAELEKNIQSDIETIVFETRRESNQKEISGHQVMRTIDRVWQTLKTTLHNIWGE